MSDTKENEEAGQGVPPAVDSQVIGEASNEASTSQQFTNDHQVIIDNLAGLEPYLDQEMNLEVQPEVQPVTLEEIKLQPVAVEEIERKPVTVEEIEHKHVTVEETAKNVENGSNDVENEKAAPPAEDANVKPKVVSVGIPQENVEDTLHSVPIEADAQILNTTECEAASDVKMEVKELPQNSNSVENDDTVCQNSVGDAPPQSNEGVENDDNVCQNSVGDASPQNNKSVENVDNVCQTSVGDAETTAVSAVEVKLGICEATDSKACDDDPMTSSHNDPTAPQPSPAGTKPEIKNVLEVENKADEKKAAEPVDYGNSNPKNMFFLDADHSYDGNESGTEEDQSAFMKELENFFRERSMEFKPPKFYGEGLNCLKLWRAVTRLGGYDKVTSCKLWRQVGESFKPPKTCTTVSWTFRGFYEKALLDYERHNIKGGELNVPVASHPEPMNIENQGSASGRARRYAAEQAMRGWHSQRLLGNGEVSDPIIKDRNSVSVQKREKQLKSINLLKRKKPSYMDNAVKAARSKPSKPQLDTAVVDIGPPADWVKINVQKTKDCFEVYALVPGLLREEVRVQSDPAGRLVISGEPEHLNNPWGVTPFKKVVSLPSRIDPHQTSAVVTLHGQLFVRVPFEQSE